MKTISTFDDNSIFRSSVLNVVDNSVFVIPTIGLTDALNGAVREVSLTWNDFSCYIGQRVFSVPAGALVLNSADVNVPTNFYIYFIESTGSAAATVSTTRPCDDPLLTVPFCMFAIVRLTSIAGVATIYYRRRGFVQQDNIVRNIGDFATDSPYTWISGGAVTIDAASGEVDMGALKYRKLKFPGNLLAINNGNILLEDETTTAANVEAIVTYSNGNPITAGKYHKLLLAVICSPTADYRFIAVRQDEPTVEYATLEEARIDSERKAATGLPEAYRSACLILAQITMLLGDASDLEIIDLREAGSVFGNGGGGAAITDHSILANLNADDHVQYHNDARALAWLGTRSADDLPDGAVNQYFTDERAQDAIGAAIVDTQDIALTYNDGANELSALFVTTGSLNVAVAAGANNNVNIGAALLVRLTGAAGNFSITGFTGGYNGRQLFVYNTVAQNMSVSDDDAGSVAANRIFTLGGSAATNGTGLAHFVYSGADSRWVLVGIRS